MDFFTKFLLEERAREEAELLGQLQQGDVLITPGVEPHVMLYLGRMFDIDHCVVHAAPKGVGVVVDSFPEEYRKTFSAYRCKRGQLADMAVMYAKNWASKNNEEKGAAIPRKYVERRHTAYSTGRYFAIKAERDLKSDPPFGYDALYRATKWSWRFAGTLSENIGVTCCAFVTACFQAAAIYLAAQGSFHRIRLANEYLEGNRGAKNESAERKTGETEIDGEPYKNYRLRKFANRGAKAGGLAGHWQQTLEILGAAGEPAVVFTEALVVDAKFNYTLNLKRRLEGDKEGWKTVVAGF